MKITPESVLKLVILLAIGAVLTATFGLFGLSLWLLLGALLLGSKGFRTWVKEQEGYRKATIQLPMWKDGTASEMFVSLTLYLLPLGLAFAVLMLALIRSGGTYLLFFVLGGLGLVLLHYWFAYGAKDLQVVDLIMSIKDSLLFAGDDRKILGAIGLALMLPLLCGLLTMGKYQPIAASEGEASERVAIEAAEDEITPDQETPGEKKSDADIVRYETVKEGDRHVIKKDEAITEKEPALAVAPSRERKNDPEATDTPEALGTNQPADRAQPAATEAATETPRPTNTLQPTATETPPPTNTREPTKVPTPVKPLVRVSVSSVNLRNGPGTAYGVARIGNEDDEFEVVAKSRSGDWYNVKAGDGAKLWVAANVVSTLADGALGQVGIAATIPAPPEPTKPPPTATSVPPTATAVVVVPTEAPPPPPPPAGQNCTPGYSPCIPPGGDVDCAGGSGNGPRYVSGPVMVSGSDPYGLDRDGDGVGCE